MQIWAHDRALAVLEKTVCSQLLRSVPSAMCAPRHAHHDRTGIEDALSGSDRLATGNAYALDECAARRRIIGSPWFAASPAFR